MRSILVYDNTFEGFLSCVFHVYEHHLKEVSIQRMDIATNNFFDTSEMIMSEEKKATRVWKGLSRYASSEIKSNLFKAFLSEIPTIEDTLLYYIRLLISSEGKMAKNYSDPKILEVAKVVKMVRREKHRMDAFVRFRLTKDDIYLATIEPDFNVVPLNAKHFKDRYADQKWLIYDLKRNYGIYYDLTCLETVTIELNKNINTTKMAALYFTPEEEQYQSLWQNYFNSTTIASRKNLKLHMRHVPKRYWKYLSEKAPR